MALAALHPSHGLVAGAVSIVHFGSALRMLSKSTELIPALLQASDTLRAKVNISPVRSLVGLNTVFGRAVMNRRMIINPAEGLTIKTSKPRRLRARGFSDKEAFPISKHAKNYKAGREAPKLAAAKGWVPWLCAFTGSACLRDAPVTQTRCPARRQTLDCSRDT
jgi:hypothetical protein